MLAFKSKRTLSSSANKKESLRKASTMPKLKLKPKRKEALHKLKPRARTKSKLCLDTTMKLLNSKSSRNRSEKNTPAKR
jgi:hypothetical protein